MAAPAASPKTAIYPQNQLQFPSSEPQRRPQPQQTPVMSMSKHTRTSSFFFPFRSRQKSDDSAHQRTVSLGNSWAVRGSISSSTPVLEIGPMNSQAGQTQRHQQEPNQVLLYTPTTMSQQQQAAGYQQPLPPTPPVPQQIPANNASPSNQAPSLARTPSQQVNKPQTSQSPPLHPEVRSVVALTVSHAHKIYFSGPLVRRVECQADGQRPHKEEGWTEVWAQLGGTTLSLWDMKEVQEASRQGREVPPAYVNVTDAFIQVLGSVTVPATATSGPKRYTNVLTLNTAGSNLLLFSCPSTPALISWASALRLSAWEKSRLEEIYTAHLIRITLSNRDYPTTLAKGRLEGWAQIRVAGQTDWKRVWMSISEGSGLPTSPQSKSVGQAPNQAPPRSVNGKKNRVSSLFTRDHSPTRSSLPVKPSITMYAGQKSKERKKPLLTINTVSQAFAVYPERPELIPRSTLIKVEGTFGDEDMAMSMKSKEGWILIMPLMEHLGQNINHSAEMLKWVIALHDAFGLYGRPQSWTWDPRDPASLMFGYPVGPQKEHLFLDREVVENMDPRDDRTSVIRSRLREMLIDFIKSPTGQSRNNQQESQTNGGAPSLPPIQGLEGAAALPANQQNPSNDVDKQFHSQRFQTQNNGNVGGPQLPPLSFGERPPEIGRPLTPITERESVTTHNNMAGGSADNQQQNPKSSSSSPPPPPIQKQPSQGPERQQTLPFRLASPQNDQSVLGRDLSHSPTAMSPPASFANPSILGNPSSAPPPSGTTLGNPSRSSFGDNAIMLEQASKENSLTNGSAPNASASPPIKISTAPLSPNRRGGSVSSVSISPRSPTFASKQKQQEQYDDTSHDETRHQDSRTGAGQPEQSLPSATPSTGDRNNDFVNEAGALYYMQQQAESGSAIQAPAPLQQPVNFDHDEYDSPSDDEFPKASQKQPAKAVSFASDNASLRSNSSLRHPPVRQSTPMAFLDNGVNNSPQADAATSPSPSDRGYAMPRTVGVGRKPSGARARQPIPKGISGQVAGYASSSHLASQYEDSDGREEQDEVGDSFTSQRQSDLPQTQASTRKSPTMVSVPQKQKHSLDSNGGFDDHSEALAALAYLNVSEPGPGSVPAPDSLNSTNGQPTEMLEPLTVQGEATDSTSGSAFKSSFAPSRQAEERKKKAQAQQAALQAAVNKPGRANGKRKKSPAVGGWAESSDEEEEEEEDDDEDVDSDGEPSQAAPPPRMQQQQANAVMQAQQQQQQFAAQSSVYPSVGGGDTQSGYAHPRPPRTLPLPPNPGSDFNGRRQPSDQYTENGRRTYYEDGPRPKPEGPAPGAARQTVWSQVLEAGRPGSNFHSPNEPTQSGRDTFVQLEPSETMTKAFTPQGLLSAGMQDKQDRSAKRQEELARETGASLINVPNKPPPPQTGLLGAITAHERERKREGGVGAALTEREREKRVAEERQRRFDEQQRQQLDQMQQGGSMYGSPYGYNPMMNPMMMSMNPMMGMSPMMTGAGGVNPMMAGQPALSPMMTGGGMNPMNPMMTGGGMNPMMGYGMMPGFNPQHLFAAQHAAQAYQNAMMAFSVAGSQVGGDGAGGPQGMNQQGMNPNMMGQGSMGAFDPRMSMNLMGMGMMGGGGMGGMGPPMGNPQMGQAPLGMQTTGMSQFDPRFAASGLGESGPLGNGFGSNQTLNTPNSRFASGTNSPIGRGSSPLRQSETPQRSRPTSPKT